MSEPRYLSIFDIPSDEEEEARLDAEALADVEAGNGIPNEKVLSWLAKLAAGEDGPPPTK